MSVWGNGLSGKCPSEKTVSGEISSGDLSVGEKSVGELSGYPLGYGFTSIEKMALKK